jgi:hypothetical protein
MRRVRNIRALRCTTNSRRIISWNAAIAVMPFRSVLNERAFVHSSPDWADPDNFLTRAVL